MWLAYCSYHQSTEDDALQTASDLGLYPFIHCCSGNHVPCSVEVTKNVVSGIRCTCLQDCCCGKGKVAEKWEVNKVSGTRFLQNLRGTTSDMEFSTPAIDALIRGPIWDALWVADIPLKRRPKV